MIEYFDINNFGSFRNFVWKDSLRDKGNNVSKFKKLNILYGRNYSGKTTISRIVRGLETGELPDKYDKPSFSVVTTSGVIDHTRIPTTNFDIRVYNRDFIDSHLSFLRDDEGNITPFAVIGSENKAIMTEIDEKERKLGSSEEKTGIRHRHATKRYDTLMKIQEYERHEESLKRKLTQKATQPPTGIKHNSLYKDPNYNTPKIKADIQKIRSQSIEILDETEKGKRETLLREEALPDIKKLLAFKPTLSTLIETTNSLISKRITPTQPINDLLNDALLQSWVKQGIAYHKEKREFCGFCSQPLPKDIWEKLDDHFNEETKCLEEDLQQHIETVKTEQNRLDTVIKVQASDFYSTFHTSFHDLKREIENEISTYRESLDRVLKSLHTRIEEIYTPQPILEISDNSEEIMTRIASINELIENNNDKTGSLEEDQSNAREELRLSEIAQFIQDIDLEGEERKVAELKREASDLNDEADEIHYKISDLEDEVEQLKVQLKDEKRGAEKVNGYLNNYFGHCGLRLETVQDSEDSTIKFQILRGENPAYNLSEGECSLVSFCYFIAKLEDADSKGKKQIIYIDDPISSLDSNHIFFVFSLIESLIAKPEEDAEGNPILSNNGNPIFRYEQLFISTHNLEFLKYLKKLSLPKKDHEHFLLVATENGSKLKLMPDYLKEYVTEFNYLFGEIYTCSDVSNEREQHHSFYNFGNNLRKFLETYLFFKYPFTESNSSDYRTRVVDFFKDDPSTEPLVQRITNEFSHLGGGFDRSIQPIDHSEIAKLASFILRKIRDNDKAQFECLLRSIGKTDPFDTA